MIINARMYAVSAAASEVWRALLARIAADAGVPMDWLEHTEPAPIEELWRRTDQGAVFMCGLPFARAEPPPVLVAAPVPSPPEFGGRPEYWSDFVVRADSGFRRIEDTFGGRLALTVPGSQSGCVAALSHFMTVNRPRAAATATSRAPDASPLFCELIAPTVTPLGALKSVIGGDADVAPIDSYALRLLQRYRPELTARVRIVGQTSRTPIPPLVASPAVAGVAARSSNLSSGGAASSTALSVEAVQALRAAFIRSDRDITSKQLMQKVLIERFELPSSESYAVLRQRFEAAARYWRTRALAGVIHPAFVPGELSVG